MLQTYQTLSSVAYIISGISFIVAIFLFFFFKIPAVISDISGRTAKKSIAKMRAENEENSLKHYKESRNKTRLNKKTVTTVRKEKTNKKEDFADENRPETGLLDENRAHIYEPAATALLNKAIVNVQKETSDLLIEDNETMLLDSSGQNYPVYPGGKKLEMIDEIIFVHTDDVIK